MKQKEDQELTPFAQTTQTHSTDPGTQNRLNSHKTAKNKKFQWILLRNLARKIRNPPNIDNTGRAANILETYIP